MYEDRGRFVGRDNCGGVHSDMNVDSDKDGELDNCSGTSWGLAGRTTSR